MVRFDTALLSYHAISMLRLKSRLHAWTKFSNMDELLILSSYSEQKPEGKGLFVTGLLTRDRSENHTLEALRERKAIWTLESTETDHKNSSKNGRSDLIIFSFLRI